MGLKEGTKGPLCQEALHSPALMEIGRQAGGQGYSQGLWYWQGFFPGWFPPEQ